MGVFSLRSFFFNSYYDLTPKTDKTLLEAVSKFKGLKLMLPPYLHFKLRQQYLPIRIQEFHHLIKTYIPRIPSHSIPFNFYSYNLFTPLPHQSTANSLNSSSLTTPNAFSCVAPKSTSGTIPFLAPLPCLRACNKASFHRPAQRHHLQPAVNPMERRLLPREALKSRKGSVSVALGGVSCVD